MRIFDFQGGVSPKGVQVIFEGGVQTPLETMYDSKTDFWQIFDFGPNSGLNGPKIDILWFFSVNLIITFSDFLYEV